jgi:hypothetical protein
MRFAMLDSDTARFQGACGVAFRLLEPVETVEYIHILFLVMTFISSKNFF